MRALFDTNVILDILLDRQPFVEDAKAIWKANRDGRFEGYVCAITPPRWADGRFGSFASDCCSRPGVSGGGR
jgi:hypothetical protein